MGYPLYLPRQSRVQASGGTSRHRFSPRDESWASCPLDPRSTCRSGSTSLLLHASVVELAIGEDPGRGTVELRRDDGSRSFVRARLVVAAGGIENPRLLLNRGVHRRKLGNTCDLFGRFFAERLLAHTGYIVPATPDLIGRTGFYPVRAATPGVHVQGAPRVVDAAQREGQLLNCALFLPARDLSIAAEAVRSLATLVKARRRGPLPAEVLGHLGTSSPASVNLARGPRSSTPPRSLPQRPGHARPGRTGAQTGLRVTMCTRRRDRLGLPVARVEWRLTASDRASIRASQKAVDTALLAPGSAASSSCWMTSTIRRSWRATSTISNRPG